MLSRKTSSWLTIISIVAVVIVAFFVVSLCLASAHGNDVVTEWQTWFGLVESAKEMIEPVEEVVEPIGNVVESMMIAC